MHPNFCKANIKLVIAVGLGLLLVMEFIKVALLIGDSTGRHKPSGDDKRDQWSYGFLERDDADDDEEAVDPWAPRDTEQIPRNQVVEEKSVDKGGGGDDPEVGQSEFSEERELKFLEKLLLDGGNKHMDEGRKSDDLKENGMQGKQADDAGKAQAELEDIDALERKEIARLERMFQKSEEKWSPQEEDVEEETFEDLAKSLRTKQTSKEIVTMGDKTVKTQDRKAFEDRLNFEEEKSDDELLEINRNSEIKYGSNELEIENTGRKSEIKYKNNELELENNGRESIGKDLSREKVSDDSIEIDTSRPILHTHPYKTVINSPNICKESRVFLLCYVYSTPGNTKRRKRIRETWGNRSNYPGVEIKTVFFVGQLESDTSSNRIIQEYLKLESERHRDIIQEDFIEDPRRLSHKGLGALKWVSNFCNNTAYVLKIDDDIFVNMYAVVNHLKNLHTANYRTRLLMCYLYHQMNIRSGPNVPKDYFPTGVYPPYCSGMGIIMSIDVAMALYAVSPYVRFLPISDVFISGVLLGALNGTVKPIEWNRVYCASFEMGVYTHPTEWYKYTFTHVHDESLNVKTWVGLTKIAKTTDIPRPSVIEPGYLADEYIPLSELFPSQ